MIAYTKPISLILIAAGSSLENQKLCDILNGDEYVFTTATSLYNCLDIAECHHPRAVILEFSTIQRNYLQVIQFLHFLHIPIILLAENLSENMTRYLDMVGVFAIIPKNITELELHKTIETSINSETLNYQLLHQSIHTNSQSLKLDETNINKKNKLQDIVNSAIGTAVSRMSEMINCEIKFAPPLYLALSPLILQDTLLKMLGEELMTVVNLDFTGNLFGSTQMLFSRHATDTIVLSLIEDDLSDDELTKMKADIMSEVGNIALNSIIGTFSNKLKYNLGYIVPTYSEASVEEIISLMKLSFKSTVITFISHFTIRQLEVEGDFILCFPARLLLDLLFS
ncbi:MAG TPA: hypothetical protein DD000_13135, partial [Cyanobacteria bacterium UBA11166]|nr:hypothetical protein [Cyanobacteria bacterium UBA11166]